MNAPELRPAGPRLNWGHAITALALALVVAWLVRPSAPAASGEPMEEISDSDRQALNDVLARHHAVSPPPPRRVTPAPGTPEESVRETFERLTGRALEEMPKLSEMRRKNADPHYAPPELTEGADTFAAVADRVRQDPRLAPEAIRFYHACATTEDAPTTIRAVCLRRLKDLAARTGSDFPIRESDYPALVRRVADGLPSETR